MECKRAEPRDGKQSGGGGPWGPPGGGQWNQNSGPPGGGPFQGPGGMGGYQDFNQGGFNQFQGGYQQGGWGQQPNMGNQGEHAAWQALSGR